MRGQVYISLYIIISVHLKSGLGVLETATRTVYSTKKKQCILYVLGIEFQVPSDTPSPMQIILELRQLKTVNVLVNLTYEFTTFLHIKGQTI